MWATGIDRHDPSIPATPETPVTSAASRLSVSGFINSILAWYSRLAPRGATSAPNSLERLDRFEVEIDSANRGRSSRNPCSDPGGPLSENSTTEICGHAGRSQPSSGEEPGPVTSVCDAEDGVSCHLMSTPLICIGMGYHGQQSFYLSSFLSLTSFNAWSVAVV